MGELDDI